MTWAKLSSFRTMFNNPVCILELTGKFFLRKENSQAPPLRFWFSWYGVGSEHQILKEVLLWGQVWEPLSQDSTGNAEEVETGIIWGGSWLWPRAEPSSIFWKHLTTDVQWVSQHGCETGGENSWTEAKNHKNPWTVDQRRPFFNPLPHRCINTGNSLVSESRFHYPLNEQVRLDKFKGAFQGCSSVILR